MNPISVSDPSAPDARRQLLSALADGEVDAAELQQGCTLWRSDAAARADWHAYHLIGDVLRAEELANPPGHDAAFLTALRSRLADEPVPLAPAAATPAPRLRAWLAPAAVAAGFVAVAGVLVVSRLSTPEAPPASQLLVSSPASAGGLQRVGAGVPAAATPLVLDGKLIRDAQLDAYLRAHRDMNGSATVAVPGGAMRSVETLAPQR